MCMLLWQLFGEINIKVCVCVLQETESVQTKDREIALLHQQLGVRVVGLGGLLSASQSGRQPSVHTNLALRGAPPHSNHACAHELWHALCNRFWPVIREVPISFIVWPRVSVPLIFRPEVNSGIGGTTPQIGVRHDFFTVYYVHIATYLRLTFLCFLSLLYPNVKSASASSISSLATYEYL